MDCGSRYKKMSLLQHIRERPDSYVGSTVPETRRTWIMKGERVEEADILYTPALYKCVDELIVNAMDQAVIDDTLDTIKIEVKDGAIVVANNGKGMPVVVHEEEGVYVPELVFGHLLTSSNYDDAEERIVGGRNGYGAKLANVFGKEFRVEVTDPERGLRYTQAFHDGMTKKAEPEIVPLKKAAKGGVSVRFVPDLEAFSMPALDEPFEALVRRRALDACACTPPRVKLFFNGQRLGVKGLDQYVDAFIGPKKERPRVSESSERWRVVVAASQEPKVVSFVNGVYTPLGGAHVEHVLVPVAKRVAEILQAKFKCAVRPAQVRERLFVFLLATIVNPAFSSQTKDALTTKASLFGSAFEGHASLAEKIVARLGIADDIVAQSRFKESRALAKTDGAKTANLRGIPGLEDALKAGTSKSTECTLILTEGLSARTFAISGLSVVGRDRYGVFPLKGKLLNVRNASVAQQSQNAEFGNIKKILGLRQDAKYDSIKQLRYGKVMVLADADVDGIHIRGLCLNLIHRFWPELLDLGFVCTMQTPIVKAAKGGETRSFFTLQEFESFKRNNDVSKWACKYYKGLGSSTPQEAKDIFRSMDVVRYEGGESSADAMTLAFDAARAADRKEWIVRATRNAPDPLVGNVVPVRDFVDRELVHFSIADVKRSIPSVVDGLKPGQRKVLYACFKKGSSAGLKVAQLTGYTSELTHYAHGEMSLNSTIVGMAQDFVGSNNVPLLDPLGQFGSRLQGGKDAASPRYISTRLSAVAGYVFKEADLPLLKRVEDDGTPLEPEFFAPVIPMVLVNGCEGIGTGFSTYVPPHNVADVVRSVRDILCGRFPRPMTPWFRGFKGTIEVAEDGRSFTTTGKYEVSGTRVRVTELPVGMWTDAFKDMVEGLPEVDAVRNESTENDVCFEIKLKEEMGKAEVEKALKLVKRFSISNMHLFDGTGAVHKYVDAAEILNDYVEVRMNLYDARKKLLEQNAAESLQKTRERLAFVTGVVEGAIPLFKAREEDIVRGALDAGVSEKNAKDFMDMPARSFAEKKIESLTKERDSLERELRGLSETPSKDMWLRDLDDLEKMIQ